MSTPPPLPLLHLVSDLSSALDASLVAHARVALAAGTAECDAALALKHAMEAETGELWHVIVGTAFGASVSHEAGCCAAFRLGHKSVLAWSSMDEAVLVRGRRARVAVGAPAAAISAAALTTAGGGEEEGGAA